MGRAPCLNRVRPGFWISSIVEYSMEGGTVLTQGISCEPPAKDTLTDPTWRAELTPLQRKHLATADITSSADLVTFDPEFQSTIWRTEPS